MAGDIALGIMCKAPVAGVAKTRLCPPLQPDEAAALSGGFIADVAVTLAAVCASEHASGYAVITPADAGGAFTDLLPPGIAVLDQRGFDLTARLINATEDLLAAGHAGVCLINADAPTLPAAVLADAITALRQNGDRIVIGPAIDGGYTLIGMTRPRPSLFQGIAWSTSQVLTQTLARAAALDAPVTLLPTWYDVDDAVSLDLLCAELFGGGIALAAQGIEGAPAPRSRRLLDGLLRAEPSRLRSSAAR